MSPEESVPSKGPHNAARAAAWIAYEKAVARSDETRDLSVPPAPAANSEPEPDSCTGLELTSQRSSLFPPIPKRGSITEYTRSEMTALHDWVSSDGKLRTHEEVADEMFEALPFARRGARRSDLDGDDQGL